MYRRGTSGLVGAVAYASAGLIGDTGGSLLCAWTPGPGNPAGKRDLPIRPKPSPRPPGKWPGTTGKLWLHVGDSGVFIVDPLTGKAAPAIDFHKLDPKVADAHCRFWTFGQSRGQDIGILPGGWVVLGGRQFYLPANIAHQPGNNRAPSSGPDRTPCPWMPAVIPM